MRVAMLLLALLHAAAATGFYDILGVSWGEVYPQRGDEEEKKDESPER